MIKSQNTLNKFEIKYLSLSFSALIIGLMFPYGFPLFGSLVFLQFLYLLLIRKKIIIFTKELFTFYFLIVIFLCAQLQTLGFDDHTKKYFINLISIMFFIINALNILKNYDLFKNFYIQAQRIAFVLAVCIAVFSMYKFYLLLNGIKISFLQNGREYPWGSSLVTDYNFSSLGYILSILFGYSLFKKSRSLITMFFLLGGISIMMITVITSGSRRGLVIILVIIFFWIIKSILSKYSFYRMKIKKVYMKKKIAYLLLLSIIFISIDNISLTNINTSELNKLLNRAETLINGDNGHSSFSSREIRWNYAGDIINNFSWYQMLIGDGYRYHYLYGEKDFSHDGVKEGYPHNILISYFLFSGTLGLFALLIFYYQTIILYIRYKKYLKEFFYFFIIATVFAMTSGDNLYGVKLYTVSFVLPFLFQYSLKHKG